MKFLNGLLLTLVLSALTLSKICLASDLQDELKPSRNKSTSTVSTFNLKDAVKRDLANTKQEIDETCNKVLRTAANPEYQIGQKHRPFIIEALNHKFNDVPLKIEVFRKLNRGRDSKDIRDEWTQFFTDKAVPSDIRLNNSVAFYLSDKHFFTPEEQRQFLTESILDDKTSITALCYALTNLSFDLDSFSSEELSKIMDRLAESETDIDKSSNTVMYIAADSRYQIVPEHRQFIIRALNHGSYAEFLKIDIFRKLTRGKNLKDIRAEWLPFLTDETLQLTVRFSNSVALYCSALNIFPAEDLHKYLVKPLLYAKEDDREELLTSFAEMEGFSDFWTNDDVNTVFAQSLKYGLIRTLGCILDSDDFVLSEKNDLAVKGFLAETPDLDLASTYLNNESSNPSKEDFDNIFLPMLYSNAKEGAESNACDTDSESKEDLGSLDLNNNNSSPNVKNNNNSTPPPNNNDQDDDDKLLLIPCIFGHPNFDLENRGKLWLDIFLNDQPEADKIAKSLLYGTFRGINLHNEQYLKRVRQLLVEGKTTKFEHLLMLGVYLASNHSWQLDNSKDRQLIFELIKSVEISPLARIGLGLGLLDKRDCKLSADEISLLMTFVNNIHLSDNLRYGLACRLLKQANFKPNHSEQDTILGLLGAELDELSAPDLLKFANFFLQRIGLEVNEQNVSKLIHKITSHHYDLYSNNESVEDPEITQSLRNNINKLKNDPLPKGQTVKDVFQEVQKLVNNWPDYSSKNEKASAQSGLHKLCHSEEYFEGLTCQQILQRVWNRIQKHDAAKELERILIGQLIYFSNDCTKGHITGLVETLDKFNDDIVLNISPSREFHNCVKARLMKALSDLPDGKDKDLYWETLAKPDKSAKDIAVINLFIVVHRPAIEKELQIEYVQKADDPLSKDQLQNYLEEGIESFRHQT